MAEVVALLKSKSLPYSASSWDEMWNRRILPALQSEQVLREDLLQVISAGEEFGTQHIFLYETSNSTAMLLTNENYVRQEVKKIGRLDLIDHPALVYDPSTLALTEIRLERGVYGTALVVKAVEKRVYDRFVGLHEKSANRFYREYERITVRAVNVFRVHANGLAELRIYSHRNTSDYHVDIEEMWGKCNFLIPQLKFKEISIGTAKRQLWVNRRNLSSIVRYSSSALRDSSGAVLSAATAGSQQSLFDNVKAAASLDAFWDENATCDRSNIWWVQNDGVPSREIHTLLSGAVNEFALTGQCSKADYEYVLEQIRRANGKANSAKAR